MEPSHWMFLFSLKIYTTLGSSKSRCFTKRLQSRPLNWFLFSTRFNFLHNSRLSRLIDLSPNIFSIPSNVISCSSISPQEFQKLSCFLCYFASLNGCDYLLLKQTPHLHVFLQFPSSDLCLIHDFFCDQRFFKAFSPGIPDVVLMYFHLS